jgi:hypothetical protein
MSDGSGTDSVVRSTAIALGAMLVLVLLFFYVPHWILSRLHVPGRDVRVWLASGWVVAALAASAYVGWRTSGPARR